MTNDERPKSEGMQPVPDAQRVVLHNRKPRAPSFHQHIVRSKLLHRTCEVGEQVVIYDVVATEPTGPVRVTAGTELVFE